MIIHQEKDLWLTQMTLIRRYLDHQHFLKHHHRLCLALQMLRLILTLTLLLFVLGLRPAVGFIVKS